MCLLFYTGHIAILSNNVNGMQIMLDELKNWGEQCQLTVNETKTKDFHCRAKAKNVMGFVGPRFK